MTAKRSKYAKAMVQTSNQAGLAQYIMAAPNVEAVTRLLEKGRATYTHAQPKTVRRWERAAKARIKQLTMLSLKPIPEEVSRGEAQAT